MALARKLLAGIVSSVRSWLGNIHAEDDTDILTEAGDPIAADEPY